MKVNWEKNREKGITNIKSGSSSLFMELLNHIGHSPDSHRDHIEYKINFYVCIYYVSYVPIVVQIKNLNYTFPLFLTKILNSLLKKQQWY